jgi:hypothetical protein
MLMPGNPKRRARLAEEAARRAAAGDTAAASPRPSLGQHMPKIRDAEWRGKTDLQKITAAFGMSLDDVLTLVSIPWAEADLHERTLKIRCFEVMLKFATRLGLEQHREESRQAMLDQLREMLQNDGD